MIALRNLNVIKKVDSEDEAKRLEAMGYKRLADADLLESQETPQDKVEENQESQDSEEEQDQEADHGEVKRKNSKKAGKAD